MRIIEEHRNHEKEIVCENCGSKLAYSEKEIRTIVTEWERMGTVKIDIFSGTTYKYRRLVQDFLRCPVCSDKIILREEFEEEEM